MSGGLKQIKDHLRAIKNIRKITATMKTVAAAKFLNAEKILKTGSSLGEASSRFYDISKVRKEIKAPDITFYAVTSDRGLCGSMHVKVCKFVKVNSKNYNKNFDIVCVGEKARSIFSFEMNKNISLVVNGIGHQAPTFNDAGKIMQRTLARPHFTMGRIVYCKFINMLSFDVRSDSIFGYNLLSSSTLLHSYDQDHVDDLISYIEFSQTMLMYYALCETFLVELSSRINAMTSASRNAAKIAETLTLEFNRKRQNTITKELIDIVSGANAIARK